MISAFSMIKSCKNRIHLVSLIQRSYSIGLKPSAIITMPSLSPSMEAGKVAVWKVKPGDKIKAGDSIADVETDKATLSFDTTDDGYIAKILVEAGELVPVGTAIAAVVDTKDDVARFANFTISRGSPKDPTSLPVQPTPTSTPSASTPTYIPSTPTPSVASTVVKPEGGLKSSPYARKVSNELGVPLEGIKGTGPGGRIIAADVIEQKEVVPTSKPTTVPTGATYIDIPNHNIRRITAERLLYSKQNIPHYYLTIECRADKLLELRAQLNQGAKDYKLSVNDFIIKASANTLMIHPVVNSEWKGDFIRQYSNIDINVAVNSPKGLLVPMIKDANTLGLKAISSAVKEMAVRAQEGKSTPTDLQMGTFSISNLGMFGISHFTAVINPPQAAILAVGNIDKRVEMGSEGPKSISVINVTLSCDHSPKSMRWMKFFD